LSFQRPRQDVHLVAQVPQGTGMVPGVRPDASEACLGRVLERKERDPQCLWSSDGASSTPAQGRRGRPSRPARALGPVGVYSRWVVGQPQ
jgi:hypothetical protein